ncbi:hypothetical protein, variant [Allomyces macrogynus ATCC 38327]|uniref:Uncharacterized protein n=1 Tax=Allomyces macrogynus (strain ATCC 38327) TaxID=578462 RepID=A0A0L0SQI7_ALLM3|nr:hypothetical protein, variant [Allomyces macrogynus ATCC 38327]|eukprot:KNE64767.1 hypothetical protein, variant [Allomyces macrogynus ATCC 38327]
MDGTELWYAPVPKKSGLNSVDVLVNVTALHVDGKATREKVNVAVAGVRGKINGIGVWRIDPAAISPNRKALLARPNATQADLAPVLISLTDYMHEFNKDTEFEVYGSCAFTYTPKHAPTSAVTLLITTKKGVAYQFTVTATRYRRQGTQHVADARVALDGGARDAARKLCRWRGHRRAVHWRRGDWRVAVRPRGI